MSGARGGACVGKMVYGARGGACVGKMMYGARGGAYVGKAEAVGDLQCYFVVASFPAPRFIRLHEGKAFA